MLAATGSKHGIIFFIFCFLFSNQFLLLELILVWIRVIGSGLALVVFPRSRLRLLRENANRPLFEMATTVAAPSSCFEAEQFWVERQPKKLFCPCIPFGCRQNIFYPRVAKCKRKRLCLLALIAPPFPGQNSNSCISFSFPAPSLKTLFWFLPSEKVFVR